MPKALNKSAKLAKYNYIVISHDDFYYCPNWDVVFKNEIEQYNHNNFYLSANTMFDLKDEYKISSKNFNISSTVEFFDEKKLLRNLDKFKTIDWQGTTKCPGLVHIDIWKKVGGIPRKTPRRASRSAAHGSVRGLVAGAPAAAKMARRFGAVAAGLFEMRTPARRAEMCGTAAARVGG